MQKYFNIINRRCFFCCSIAGLAINAVRATLPFGIEQKSNMEASNQEFLIVNGWVLTRKDVTASEMTSDAV